MLLNRSDLALRRPGDLNPMEPEDFWTRFTSVERPRLYTNSEDALGAVLAALDRTALGQQIRVAKD